MKKLLPLILLSNILNASDFSHSLSNQGFTGVINTPSAQVMNQGELVTHYDNQFDNVLRAYNNDKKYSYQEDYIVGIGFLHYFELQGRLSEARGFHRDLSANLKFQVPYKHEYLPTVAFGIQDLGSAANHFGNKYIVMDKQASFIRASLGYGVSDGPIESKKRMDGVFGALEIKTFDWMYILAEDDSREQFVGLRFETPKSWNSNIQLSTMLSSNISDNYETSIGINLKFSLYKNTNDLAEYILLEEKVVNVKSDNLIIENDAYKAHESNVELDKYFTVYDVRDKLRKLGIENITIGVKNASIYCSYENNVFLFNDLDALGVVIGLLSKTKYSQFIIEQKKSKVTTLIFSGDLKEAREFYKNPSLKNKLEFTHSFMKLSNFKKDSYYMCVKNENDSFLKAKVELKPLLTTFIGNEFGLANYKLWLRTKFQTNLYEGVDLTVVGDIHLHDSKIDDYRYDYFVRLYENDTHIESVMLHASTNFLGGINTLSIGSFKENYMGVMEQYTTNYKNHTLMIKAGYFREFEDSDPYKEVFLGEFPTRELYLLKYSYLLDDYDLSGELNIGQYWEKDRGFDIKLKRFFGDVAVYAVYEQTTPYAKTMFSETKNHYAGFGIEIPLTLRHTVFNESGQLQGTNAFSHQIKSTIARKDGTNTVVPGGNNDPEVAIESENYFYNRNRLHLSYIKKHVFRFIESYEKYGK